MHFGNKKLSMALDSRVNRLEEKGVDRGRTWQ
jgi:hypothetical protein